MNDAKAIAQVNALDEAARLLKQRMGSDRKALQLVRQVQAELNGIQVETIAQSKETEHGSENSRKEAA